jgi:hypothetical protein
MQLKVLFDNLLCVSTDQIQRKKLFPIVIVVDKLMLLQGRDSSFDCP